MDQDHHPSPQQGPQEVVPEPPERPAAEAESPAAEAESPPPRDVIMSKLPRTRPQRVTERRRREQAREPATGSTPTPLRSQKTQTAARAATRPKPRASSAVKRAAASTAAKPRASAAARPKRSTQAKPAARRAPAPRVRDTAQAPPAPATARREQGNGAPSLPRLAVDGAVEAAKLPLRVGGRLTLRALDAVARGLRGG